MIEKVALIQGESGAIVLPRGKDRSFEKTAGAPLLPEVLRFIEYFEPRPDAQYVLLSAVGAGEYWGPNVNGDHFPEAALVHRPEDWSHDPSVDRSQGLYWPYGFPTFYGAHPFLHHRNKDPARAYGGIELATWNDRMKRVELVVRLDRDKCEQLGGMNIWQKLSAGQCPDVSMGCRVPFDTCSICCDWDAYRRAQATFDPNRHRDPGEAVLAAHKELKARSGEGIRGLSITRADYCEHTRNFMNCVLPDGRRIFVYNDYPKFFDISFVFVGADKTAKVMMQLRRNGPAKHEKVAGVVHATQASSRPFERYSSLADEVLKHAFYV